MNTRKTLTAVESELNEAARYEQKKGIPFEKISLAGQAFDRYEVLATQVTERLGLKPGPFKLEDIQEEDVLTPQEEGLLRQLQLQIADVRNQ